MKVKECERKRGCGMERGRKVVMFSGGGRERERERERLAQCDIQSGDESQHKKLKAAAEISRLISIQIRHKFYMPNV